MNTTTHFDPWHNRHTINMEPEQMDKFSDEYSLFAGQPNEKQKWKSPFLICTICTAVPLRP